MDATTAVGIVIIFGAALACWAFYVLYRESIESSDRADDRKCHNELMDNLRELRAEFRQIRDRLIVLDVKMRLPHDWKEIHDKEVNRGMQLDSVKLVENERGDPVAVAAMHHYKKDDDFYKQEYQEPAMNKILRGEE